MKYQCFDLTVDEGVAHIQMSRGDKLNTMIKAFWTELPDLLKDLDKRGDVRVAVLSSTGKHFCAGMALENFGGNEHSIGADTGPKDPTRAAESLRRTAMELQEAFTTLERVRFPVLAAIQGGCIGGAVDMVTACDMRYCSADAWFCIQEINIGMTADVGTLQRLPKLIAPGIVREIAYTGERVSSQRSRELGLVNQVYETQEQMLEAVMEIARVIAGKSPLAIFGTKHSLNFARDHSVDDSLQQIATWNAAMLSSKDLMEGLGAQSEKRASKFEDLRSIKRYG